MMDEIISSLLLILLSLLIGAAILVALAGVLDSIGGLGKRLFPNWSIWVHLRTFIDWVLSDEKGYVRGAKIITPKLAESYCQQKRQRHDCGVSFGCTKQPTQMINDHFLFIGAPGTGKTTSIRLLLQDLLAHMTKGSHFRALLYDPKLEMIPQLCSQDLGLAVPLVVTNPFDKRSFAWDIASDVVDMPTAREVSQLLVPDVGKPDGNSAFFTSTSRRLLAGIMRALMKRAPNAWTFTDVLIACDDPDRMKALLGGYEGTKSLIPKLCSKEATFQDIYATLSDRIDSFREVAAIYRVLKDKRRPTFSLSKWSQTESILLLGNDKTRGDVLDPLNRVFFHLAAKFTTQPQSRRPANSRTLFVVDEVQQAGRLDGLNDLLTTGRSYGVTVVLGCQSRDGLEKPGMFSEEEANEIVEQCGHRLIGRVNDKTAKWSSELIGTTIRWESDARQGVFGINTSGFKDTMKLQERPAVLPATFQQLPDLKHQDELHAYCYSPTTQYWWKCEAEASAIFGQLHRPSMARKHVGFIPTNSHPTDQTCGYLVTLTDDQVAVGRIFLPPKMDCANPIRMGKIIAVTNSKGGVGKTTTSVHLAVWLHEQGHRVSLIDCDKQGSTTKWMERAVEKKTLPDIKTERCADPDYVLDALVPYAANYDYVIADGPGGDREITRSLLMVADRVLVPCKASMLEAWALADANNLLLQAQRIRDGLPPATIFLSMVRPRYKLAADMIKGAEALKLPIADTYLTLRQAYADSIGKATVVWKMDRRQNIAAKEAQQLFAELFPEVKAKRKSKPSKKKR